MSENMKDVVIIGSGPAGLSAAVYAKRATLDEVVVEKEMISGGQIIVTDRIDNYLGDYGVSGYDLSVKFREHADKLDVPFMEGNITSIEDKGDYKQVILENGNIVNAKAVVIATGATHKKLNVSGEDSLSGAGVSYCATCDGAFFKGKTVAVVGGGDVALGDALYLSNICDKVYLIHRRDGLRGAKVLQERVFAKDNIEFMPFYEVDEICGGNSVEELILHDNRTNEKSKLSVSGIFIAVGMKPQSDLVKNLVKLDDAGYICAGEDCRTSVKGIYAAGDVRTKSLRQIVTAVADGAVAISSVEEDFIK